MSIFALQDSSLAARAAGNRPRAGHLACLLLCVFFAWLLLSTIFGAQRLGSRDFLQEWTSARNWLAGRAIYAPLSETLPVYFGPAARSVVEWNAHPPPAVLLALPLARLPYDEAWRWWNVASLAAMIVSLWLLLGRRGLNTSLAGWIPFGLLFVSSNALKEQVQQGQLNGWLLLLIVAAWLLDRSGRPWASGACLGVAAAIKLFPGFLVVYFVARRDWRACLAFAGSLVGLSVLAAAVLGWQAYGDYVTLVLPSLGEFRASWLNASLVGFWTKTLIGRPDRMQPLVFSPDLARVAILVSWALVIGAVARTAWTARSQRGRDVAFAAATIGMLLVSPITWDHYFLLLLPAIAILWHARGQRGANRLLLGILAVLLLTLRPGWIFSLAIPGPGEFAGFLGMSPPLVEPWQTLTALSYACYGLMALFAVAVYEGTRSEDHGPSLNSAGAEVAA